MKETRYYIQALCTKKTTIALISDLHNQVSDIVFDSLKAEKPEFIAVNGDLLYASSHGRSIYHENPDAAQHFRTAPNAVAFLKEASRIGRVLFQQGIMDG